jgi:Fe-S cluster biogenesis protein NfuA
MPINIQLEWTPNPSTLKYVVDRRLLPSGALDLKSAELAKERSPLGAKLFEVPGVVSVMLGTTFVTITKGEAGEWDELNDSVMAILDSHLSANLPVVNADFAPATAAGAGPETDVEKRIRAVLEADIRPAVMQDGGDIVLERFEAGIAYLQMKGSCSGCPSSTMTLKMGVEARLVEMIPEVREVVSI